MRCSLIAFALSLGAPAKLLSEIVFTTVALSGQPAPGTPTGVNFDSAFFYPVVNDAGAMAFRTRLLGPVGPARDARFSGADAGATLLARVGDQAPGCPAGVVIQSLSDADLNANGQVAFSARLSGTGVTTQNDSAIFSGSSAALTVVARKGSPAATLSSTISYGDLSTPAFADDGSIAFIAKLVGTAVSATNDSAVFLGKPSALAIFAREGNAMPAAEPGTFYDEMFSTYGPTLNNSGVVAYDFNLLGAGVTSANNRAIVMGTSSSIAIVARKGGQAASFPEGVVYGPSLGMNGPSLNDAGQVAFGPALAARGQTQRLRLHCSSPTAAPVWQLRALAMPRRDCRRVRRSRRFRMSLLRATTGARSRLSRA